MGRPSLRTLVAFSLAVPCATAGAAEVTRVASSGEPDKVLEVGVSARWDRDLRRAKITREAFVGGANVDATELRYQQVTNRIVPRIAIGLWHDLEIHAEMPYFLSDEHSWRYALVDGRSTGPTSTIGNNDIDASGNPCGARCPILPVNDGGPMNTVYHGGALGDLKLGIAWGILSDRRDDTKPFWLVGLDVTMPTAERYDPSTAPDHTSSSSPAPVGHKIWVYDFYTAFSRRVGPVDPYLKAHVALPATANGTYSNCEHAAQLAAAAGNIDGSPEMASWAPQNCANALWRDRAGARPPVVFGMMFGTELVPYEDRAAGEQVSIDLRLAADYYGAARWYNELTDATGKLLHTDPYLDLSALLGVYLRASRHFALKGTAEFHHETTHLISGEGLGRYGDDPSIATTHPEQLNPNFDYRYDQPGHRFRVSETTVFTIRAGVEVTF